MLLLENADQSRLSFLVSPFELQRSRLSQVLHPDESYKTLHFLPLTLRSSLTLLLPLRPLWIQEPHPEITKRSNERRAKSVMRVDQWIFFFVSTTRVPECTFHLDVRCYHLRLRLYPFDDLLNIEPEMDTGVRVCSRQQVFPAKKPLDDI